MIIKSLKKYLLSLSRGEKSFFLVLFDSLAISIAFWSSLAIRKGEVILYSNFLIPILPILITITIISFIRLGLYRAVLRYVGGGVVWAVIRGVTISTLVLATSVTIYRLEGFPRSVIFIYWLLAVLYVAGTRFLIRDFLVSKNQNFKGKKTAIYGAGTAGHELSRMLINNSEASPVCFIDDNKSLWGRKVNNLNVHSIFEIEKLIKEYDIEQILLAIPSASHLRRKEIIDYIEKYPVKVFTIPSIEDIIAGKAKVNEIREVDIEDLLGRDSIPANQSLLHACVTDKVVMITGAGGSIGSELCRQILTLKPKELILFELSEYALYEIEQELSKIKIDNKELSDIGVVSLLGNVQDKKKLKKVIERFNVQTIYHAAAYKHVPIVEHNIIEGVNNNILGTYNCGMAAIEGNVETFVLISTDKAVRPTNIMGATKRFAEMVLQMLSHKDTKTRFCMVRFGNVLGSSGSVVPVFRKQIKNGGPVTVTHPDIIRYFMTIPEAAQLVIQAGSMGQGGDVFVLDMGDPVKIDQLARKMIHLMGFTVKGDGAGGNYIEIKYTGLRPGEKLFEELLVGENVTGTEHPMILRAEELSLSAEQLLNYLGEIEHAVNNNDTIGAKEILVKAVSGYKPEKVIVDHLHDSDSGDSTIYH